jgi:hypothetical protein
MAGSQTTPPNLGSVDPNFAAYNSAGGAQGPNFTPVLNTKPSAADPSAASLIPQTFGPGGGSSGGMKYNVGQYAYPETVAGAPDLQHYMVFFINVRGKSKYKNNFGATTPVQTVAGGLGTLAQNQTAQGAVGIGGALLGAAAGSLVGKAAGLSGSGATLLKLAGGVGGYLAGNNVASALGLFQPDRSYRVSQSIMMAINEKPSVKYSVQYDGKDLGTFVGYLGGGGSAADVLKSGARNKEMLTALAMNVANIPSGIANLIGANLDLGSALQFGMGAAPNPFREQIFHNVDTRQFQIDYKFLPRSQSEAMAVQNIIKAFKFHMHPELSSGGLFYIYPSTFDIAYYYNGQKNPYLHKISTSVLESMSVDYGGQGFNTFADGSPTEINIRLLFRELEVMTKERINLGY